MIGILDVIDWKLVRTYEDEDESIARKTLYNLRKHRYIDEHPDRPSWEYDTMKHDNGYNLVKYSIKA